MGPTSAAGGGGVVDYSKGPGALEKAAHLFFFTEIVRGESSIFYFSRLPVLHGGETRNIGVTLL